MSLVRKQQKVISFWFRVAGYGSIRSNLQHRFYELHEPLNLEIGRRISDFDPRSDADKTSKV
jgi:hypothetical protein